MVSVKKYIPCKCGANNYFEFNSDMHIEDVTVSARCPACSAPVTVALTALFSPSQPAPQQQEPSKREVEENVEQAVRDLFKY